MRRYGTSLPGTCPIRRTVAHFHRRLEAVKLPPSSAPDQPYPPARTPAARRPRRPHHPLSLLHPLPFLFHFHLSVLRPSASGPASPPSPPSFPPNFTPGSFIFHLLSLDNLESRPLLPFVVRRSGPSNVLFASVSPTLPSLIDTTVSHASTTTLRRDGGSVLRGREFDQPSQGQSHEQHPPVLFSQCALERSTLRPPRPVDRRAAWPA